MKRLLLSTAISIAACCNANTTTFTASTLSNMCNSGDTGTQGQCSAYLLGIWEAVTILQAAEEDMYKKAGKKPPSEMICAAGQLPTGADMRSIMKLHARKHAMTTAEPAAAAAINAFMDAYPCPE